jgi:hypothetical protein
MVQEEWGGYKETTPLYWVGGDNAPLLTTLSPHSLYGGTYMLRGYIKYASSWCTGPNSKQPLQL